MSKIAFVGNTSFSMYVFRSKVMQHFVEKGEEIYCIAPRDEYTVNIEELGVNFIPVAIDRKGSSVLKDWSFYKNLKALYRKHEFDMIFHYTIKPNIYGTNAASSLNIPNYAFITGLGYTFINNNLTSRIAKMLYRRSLKYADKVFFLNQQDMDLFTEQGLVPSGMVEVMSGEGVDVEKFTLPLKKWSDEVHYIYIGRLLIDKGINELLDSFTSLSKTNKRIKLHIIGDVDPNYRLSLSKEEFDNKIAECDQIIYHGYQKDILPYLELSHFLILPSYREGLSTVTLEAMSCMRPVIGSDVPGINNIIDSKEDGYLCEARSVESLQKAITESASLNENEYNRIAQKARKKIVSKFSVDNIIEFYETNIIKNQEALSHEP